MSTEQQDSNKATPVARRVGRACLGGCRCVNRWVCGLLAGMLKLTLVGYFIFCVLFLTLRYAVLPNVDRYKNNVEQMASHALGRQVSIARIHASWDGLRPQLALDDVVIHGKSGERALNLPKVSATLSWWSLAVADLQLYTLEINRADLDIQRDAGGNLFIAGIPVDMRKRGDGRGADWILSQREIIIRDGRVRWNDARRGAPELALGNVNFVLHNSWRHHRFALKATPPAALATPLDIRADFYHQPFIHQVSDVSRWKGQLYAYLQDTDLATWKAYFDYPIELQKGNGSVRAWLNFDHAKIADFTADLTLSNVFARLRKDLPPLDLAQVKGRVSVKEEVAPGTADGKPTFGTLGHTISLSDFSMQTTDGFVLPSTTITETFTAARKGQPETMQVKAKRLDLQTLAKFVERLPLPAGQRQILADYAPRGQVEDFSVQWQGTYPEISAYQLKGKFAGLSMNAQAPRAVRAKTRYGLPQAAVPAIPGFENLTGEIDASERGGAFTLASEKLKLHVPGYFNDPVMFFDQLNMRANWAFREKEQLFLQVDKMDFVQENLSASLSGTHLMPLNMQHGKPTGAIDVSGRVSGFDVTRIDRYLPLQTPEKLRAWLTGALEGGIAQDVSIKVKGDLADFPFRSERAGEKPKGEFIVAGRIQNGKLNYAPGLYAKDGNAPLWPQAEEINGTIVFDRMRMEIKADTAKTSGVALSNVRAVIPDLLAPDKQLDIDGNAAGALQDFVRYVNISPVGEWIGHFTEETKGSGNAKLALKLQLPLHHLLDSKVNGTLQFMNNDVTLMALLPPLQQASGRLEFYEKGFSLNDIRTSFLGSPVSVFGGTQRDGTTLVRADGTVTAEGLRKTYAAMPQMHRLLQHLNGGTRYTASIGVRKKRPEIIVESTMQGMGLDFPVPLRKEANESWPLKFELAGLASDAPGVMRDQIKLALGTAIGARYVRQKAADKDAPWHVVQGGIGVNVPPPEPDSGLIANVNLKQLNIDAWRQLAGSVAGPSDQTKETSGNADALAIAQYVEPEILAARATELVIMDRKLDNVVVGASHQKGIWQANIDSEQASGYVTWNESRSGRGLGRVSARLASLIVPKSAASEVTALLEGKNESTQIPGLDIVAENFELFGKQFGHLELLANNIQAPGGREWRISKLSIQNPDAELKASGKWSSKDGVSMSSLSYSLEIENAGKLLDRLGFSNVLKGGKGKMAGDLNWNGLPFSIDIPSLSGQFQMDVKAGQFLKVDPSAAKLLGVLNLQSLPRRLALDFHDVFSEGYSFDGVTANATIADGIVKTDNFKMRSVTATVLIDGAADIAKESQNIHVVVLPEVNAGAASIVYALAVNPVIGLGSFLAQLFLREPLMKAFTNEYAITGPWKQPVVAKLDRKTGAAKEAESSALSDNLEKAR